MGEIMQNHAFRGEFTGDPLDILHHLGGDLAPALIVGGLGVYEGQHGALGRKLVPAINRSLEILRVRLHPEVMNVKKEQLHFPFPATGRLTRSPSIARRAAILPVV